MQFFSRASQYALRAMVHVVAEEKGMRFNTEKVCQAADIPLAYGRKVFQDLARARILRGERGPGGGYRFDRALDRVRLIDVVHAVDGAASFTECPLGVQCRKQRASGGFDVCSWCVLTRPHCGHGQTCPLQGEWKTVRSRMIGRLENTTLADIHEAAGKA